MAWEEETQAKGICLGRFSPQCCLAAGQQPEKQHGSVSHSVIKKAAKALAPEDLGQRPVFARDSVSHTVFLCWENKGTEGRAADTASLPGTMKTGPA